MDVLHRSGHRQPGKRVVTIGGGTGPFAVLSSLKHYPCSITAIVTMSDSGGSSRREARRARSGTRGRSRGLRPDTLRNTCSRSGLPARHAPVGALIAPR